jgi:cell division protein FtsI (penicillin-binding protein 3)
MAQSLRHRSTFRLWMLGGLSLVGAGYLGYKLYQLQVTPDPRLATAFKQEHYQKISTDLPRRTVSDRNGTTLAIDQPVYDVILHPQMLDKQAKLLAEQKKKDVGSINRLLRTQLADQLAMATGLSPTTFAKKLQSTRKTVVLVKHISQSAKSRIQAIRFSPDAKKKIRPEGFEFTARHKRIYPDQANSAALIGFLNPEDKGLFGVEQKYESILQSSSSSNHPVQITKTGVPLPEGIPTELMTNATDARLALTIDIRLQRATRLALEKGAKANSVTRGTAIVLDPKSGEILALAVTPTFNNNDVAHGKKHFGNWAVTDIYEPGSTFKPINVAIALTAGTITPNTYVYDEGQMKFGRFTVSNYDHQGRGSLSVTQVLMFSDNIGMIKLMKTMRTRDYLTHLEALGLRGKSGIDLPGENHALLADKFSFINYPATSATTAFGQGLALTPLQLIRLHGAIANGGMLIEPRIVRGLEDSEGALVNVRSLIKPTPHPPRRVFTPEAAHAVQEMMFHVVQEGTGKPARIPGYAIGGKTGTAQKANLGGHGYLKGKKITSFVAYLPAKDPKYVVLVVLDEPKSENAFGSTTAAPIAREICQELIAYANLLPTMPIVKKPSARP